jgi:hypothetical protein
MSMCSFIFFVIVLLSNKTENGTVVFSTRHQSKSHTGKPIEFMVGRKQVVKGTNMHVKKQELAHYRWNDAPFLLRAINFA